MVLGLSDTVSRSRIYLKQIKQMMFSSQTYFFSNGDIPINVNQNLTLFFKVQDLLYVKGSRMFQHCYKMIKNHFKWCKIEEYKRNLLDLN